MEWRCETCRFWQRALLSDNDTRGRCVRHAPRPIPDVLFRLARRTGDDVDMTDELDVNWPSTDFDEGCGEHEPRRC